MTPNVAAGPVMRAPLVIAIGALAWCAAPLAAQTYSIPWHVVAAGGTSASPPYTVTDTIGALGSSTPMTGGPYQVNGGFWAVPVSIAAPFTDEPLVAGASIVKAVHVNELRNRINAQRTRFGLGAAAWTDPSLGVGASVIKAAHVTEMRSALQGAYAQAGTAFPALADAVLTAGMPVRAVHLSQLRIAVKNLEDR